jgi:hypothetical protein
MIAFLRHGNGLIKLALVIACLALAVLWPQWRVALQTQGYYPPAEGWCSPGYWKNHPDEANVAAEACGLNMDETTYSSQFDAAPPRSPKGVRDNASTDPTLRLVLNNPQWYGGDAANNVGDLLSDCHPGVDFEPGDERVEDSCPLN